MPSILGKIRAVTKMSIGTTSVKAWVMLWKSKEHSFHSIYGHTRFTYAFPNLNTLENLPGQG